VEIRYHISVEQILVPANKFDELSKDELKALLLSERAEHKAELQSHRLIIEHMKLTILKLRQMQFGQRSEKRAQEIEQLELGVEQLEAADALRTAVNELAVGSENSQSPLTKTVQTPVRRREFPAHLPREVQTIEPEEKICPDCGDELKRLGEDVSEMLELEPVRFKVIRYIRPKHACKGCDKIVQAPAPNRPIDRGIAGPGLLAHVVVSKYADHCVPRIRQQRWRCRTVQEMRVGPSESVIRSGFQTTASCCRKERWW